MFVTHPAYIREKARQMRVEKDLTIDEIAERLAISRQTIFYWVRDLPMRRPRRWSPAQQRGNGAMRLKYKRLRDKAYEEGWEAFDDLILEPSFRDFVCMYIGEGYKRSRNDVAICNSNPTVMILADFWIRRFANNPVRYSLQYHADQDVDDLKRVWARLLRIDPEEIRLQRKSNSNQLNGRSWRSRWGVLTVGSADTYFRARLQAWMDRIFEEWLDSAG
jgi:transcriptional regulator with XRE-family HTH domain